MFLYYNYICVCTYICSYFHFVIKCLELWRMKCSYKLWNLYCSLESVLNIISNSHSFFSSHAYYVYFALYLFCFMFGTLHCIPFYLVGFLGIFRQPFFFSWQRKANTLYHPETFLTMIDIHHTCFLLESMFLGALWLPYSNLNILGNTELPF